MVSRFLSNALACAVRLINAIIGTVDSLTMNFEGVAGKLPPGIESTKPFLVFLGEPREVLEALAMASEGLVNRRTELGELRRRNSGNNASGDCGQRRVTRIEEG